MEQFRAITVSYVGDMNQCVSSLLYNIALVFGQTLTGTDVNRFHNGVVSADQQMVLPFERATVQ